ncbi:hypothetical protein ACIA8O_03580 [Kitasatospora sp. NPDC051853]|uniref:hypothetical protein n=1 Tax=Kitasatospora sp. NPDC051853 TaxID=3364058 RepID=UPI003798226E
MLRLCLAAPWWRDAPGGTAEQLRAVAELYREDHPDLDGLRRRAAVAVGLDPASLPSGATVLTRLAERSRGPLAEVCRVLGHQGEPLGPLFGQAARPGRSGGVA